MMRDGSEINLAVSPSHRLRIVFVSAGFSPSEVNSYGRSRDEARRRVEGPVTQRIPVGNSRVHRQSRLSADRFLTKLQLVSFLYMPLDWRQLLVRAAFNI